MTDRRCRQCGTIGSWEIVDDHVSCAECGAVVAEVVWFPTVPEVSNDE